MGADSNARRFCIEPRFLGIQLTYHCPFRCGHCYAKADIHKKGHIPIDVILSYISQAAELQSIRRVSFMGGEPFLYRSVLEEAIRYASALEFKTRIVTNAFWARSEDRALRVLQPLAEAGLFDIVVSYDDNHAPFIREANIVHAFRAASALGVKFSINICREPGCVIDRCYVERMLGLEEGQTQANIIESWINSTGRAKDEDSPEKQRRRQGRPEVLLGPCCQMLQGPALTPTGKIQACCGLISYKEGLVIGATGTDTLLQALQRAYKDPLLKWIAFDGPGAVLERITEGTPDKITASDLDGNCHACDLLFSDPIYLDLAQAVAKGPLGRILALQESYLVRTGMLRYPGCVPAPDPA